MMPIIDSGSFQAQDAQPLQGAVLLRNTLESRANIPMLAKVNPSLSVRLVRSPGCKVTAP
jgi:hypothetical protein